MKLNAPVEMGKKKLSKDEGQIAKVVGTANSVFMGTLNIDVRP